MTQKDIKDIKLGASDVQHLMFRYWEVWPNSGTKHQKDWPFIVITNFSETDAAIVCFNKGGDAKYIEFSTDGINWYNIHNNETSFYYSGTGEYRVTIGGRRNSRKSVYFRGSNNKSLYGFNIITVASETFDGYTNPDVHCFGNIMSLLDYQTIPTEITADLCFATLFAPTGGTLDLNNRPNVLKSANILYADKICSRCYWGMFSGCTSLVEAPELPATELAKECYSGMFSSCTSLVEAPELPATTLAERCYSTMFHGCTSLVEAPELPATTLAEWSYERMFKGCTSLVEAPELPATTLAEWSYSGMFHGCTSLVEAPEIYAPELKRYCCSEMFADCTSLVKAPKLLAQTLAENCYEYMFKGCKSLVKAPEIHSTRTATRCFSYMFKNCTSLVEIPWIPPAGSNYCCEYMFENCTSLTQAILTFKTLGGTSCSGSCSYMFKGCTSLNYVKLPFIEIFNPAWYDSIYGSFVGWLEGVSETGTFIKSKDATWENSDIGIPEGWTVILE